MTAWRRIVTAIVGMVALVCLLRLAMADIVTSTNAPTPASTPIYVDPRCYMDQECQDIEPYDEARFCDFNYYSYPSMGGHCQCQEGYTAVHFVGSGWYTCKNQLDIDIMCTNNETCRNMDPYDENRYCQRDDDPTVGAGVCHCEDSYTRAKNPNMPGIFTCNEPVAVGGICTIDMECWNIPPYDDDRYCNTEFGSWCMCKAGYMRQYYSDEPHDVYTCTDVYTVDGKCTLDLECININPYDEDRYCNMEYFDNHDNATIGWCQCKDGYTRVDITASYTYTCSNTVAVDDRCTSDVECMNVEPFDGNRFCDLNYVYMEGQSGWCQCGSGYRKLMSFDDPGVFICSKVLGVDMNCTSDQECTNIVPIDENRVCHLDFYGQAGQCYCRDGFTRIDVANVSGLFTCAGESLDIYGEDCWVPGYPHLYAGQLNTTLSGLPCLAWADDLVKSTYPDLQDHMFPVDGSISAAENFCRRPIDPADLLVEWKQPQLWCFVDDFGTAKSEPCWIFQGISEALLQYSGTLDKTISGRPCKTWDTYVYYFLYETNPGGPWNHCRIPYDGKTYFTPVCHVDSPLMSMTEICDVPGGCTFQISFEGIRLADSVSPGQGRVELLYNGIWGTICDIRENGRYAGVLCVMLGYARDDSSMLPKNVSGAGQGPIYLSDVYCMGAETDILQCRHAPFGLHLCNHDNDVGISCFVDSQPTTTTTTATTTTPSKPTCVLIECSAIGCTNDMFVYNRDNIETCELDDGMSCFHETLTETGVTRERAGCVQGCVPIDTADAADTEPALERSCCSTSYCNVGLRAGNGAQGRVTAVSAWNILSVALVSFSYYNY